MMTTELKTKPLINWDGPGWYSSYYNNSQERLIYHKILAIGTYHQAQAEAEKLGHGMASYFEDKPHWMIEQVI